MDQIRETLHNSHICVSFLGPVQGSSKPFSIMLSRKVERFWNPLQGPELYLILSRQNKVKTFFPLFAQKLTPFSRCSTIPGLGTLHDSWARAACVAVSSCNQILNHFSLFNPVHPIFATVSPTPPLTKITRITRRNICKSRVGQGLENWAFWSFFQTSRKQWDLAPIWFSHRDLKN